MQWTGGSHFPYGVIHPFGLRDLRDAWRAGRSWLQEQRQKVSQFPLLLILGDDLERPSLNRYNELSAGTGVCSV